MTEDATKTADRPKVWLTWCRGEVSGQLFQNALGLETLADALAALA